MKRILEVWCEVFLSRWRGGVDDIVQGLSSRDPQLRDVEAYGAFYTAVVSGRSTITEREEAASQLLSMLKHPELQARTFAALGFAILVEHGDWNDAWFEQAAHWYLNETDLRGYDAELGWLHAVAHGADFFGACGVTGRVPAGRVLDVLAQRLIRDTEFVWRDLEEGRVAAALALALFQPGLAEADAVSWMDAVQDYASSVPMGPLPPALSNTTRTLSALVIGLGEIVVNGDAELKVPHADVVRQRCLDICQPTVRWFWRRRLEQM